MRGPCAPPANYRPPRTRNHHRLLHPTVFRGCTTNVPNGWAEAKGGSSRWLFQPQPPLKPSHRGVSSLPESMGAFQTCFSPSSCPRSNRAPPTMGYGICHSQLILRLGETIPLRTRGGKVPAGTHAPRSPAHTRIVESRAEWLGRASVPRCDSGVVTETGGRQGRPQTTPRSVPAPLRARPVGRGRPPPSPSPPLSPQWSRPAPADRPGIPAGSRAPPRPPRRAPAPPWETLAASAARRPACHRAAPAASGGKRGPRTRRGLVWSRPSLARRGGGSCEEKGEAAGGRGWAG